MSSDPMTEEQGDEIIGLLKDLLYELKKVTKDSSSVESEIRFELHRIRESLTNLKH